MRLVSASFDTTAITWSLASGTADKVLRFHEGAVNCVAFLSDGRVATSGEDTRIAIWRPGDDKPTTVLRGHTAPVAALAVSLDGAWLASAAWDNTARLWPLAGGEPRVEAAAER
jgi:cytochrome c